MSVSGSYKTIKRLIILILTNALQTHWNIFKQVKILFLNFLGMRIWEVFLKMTDLFTWFKLQKKLW